MVGETTLNWQQHELSGVRRGQDVSGTILEHLRQVAAIKHSEEDSGCTNCLCMENWYRTGCPSVVSQLYDQILQGLLTMLSSWHDKAGAEKGRLMRKVYCALCKDEAVVCSLGWRGEVEIDKVEPGRDELSPFVSLPTKSQSLVFEICKERPI